MQEGIYHDNFGGHTHPLASENKAILARHNALVEAIHKAMERTADCDKKQTDDQIIADVAYLKRLASDHFKTSVDCGNRAFAAEQKYDALREAVTWERECGEVKEWLSYIRHTDSRLFLRLISSIAVLCGCARAEVDRLIANADDCEGEG